MIVRLTKKMYETIKEALDNYKTESKSIMTDKEPKEVENVKINLVKSKQKFQSIEWRKEDEE